MDPSEMLRALVLTVVPMILSYAVHECAHAWVAYKLGDPTAKDEGRATLNPAVHIDVWGTILIPSVSALAGNFRYFGWARPTPFRVDRMRPGVNPRLGSALVAIAGPVSNALLAILMAAVMAILVRANVPITKRAIALYATAVDGDFTPLGRLLYAMFEVNVALFLINLFPIPPLDGHRLLPRSFDRVMLPLQRWGFALLLAVFLFLPSLANAIFYRPMHWITSHLLVWFGVI